MGLLELFKRKEKTSLWDRNKFLTLTCKPKMYHVRNYVKFSVEEIEVLEDVLHQIINNVVYGTLYGTVTWKRQLSPLANKMIEFVANNCVYYEDTFKVDYNWSDLTREFTQERQK